MDFYDIPINSERQDLVYKRIGDTELMLTFIPPVNKIYEKAPVYLIFAGGGWISSKRETMIAFSHASVDKLREAGFAVAAPSYRSTSMSCDVVMDDCISDCFDAARYLSHFADELGIDKNMFAVSGHSAGAHLALMVAYAPKNAFINDSVLADNFSVFAAAAMSPATVLYEINGAKPLVDDMPVLVKNQNTADRKRWSPYDYACGTSPATLLCAGTKDPIIFYDSSKLLFERLKDAGAVCDIATSNNGGHCFEKIGDGEEPDLALKDMQKEIVRFILNNMHTEKTLHL